MGNRSLSSPLVFNQLSSYQRKQKLILKLSVEAFVKSWGFGWCGFLTLTFVENLCDFKEAQRRFNSMASNLLRDLFSAYVCIVERQKRGAVHYHLLVACKKDIRRGLNFEAVMRHHYHSGCPYLRELWEVLRKSSSKYGFGRTELLPIRTNPAKVASYLAKYFVKAVAQRDPATHRHRLIRYSKGSRQGSCRFQWVNGQARLWRAVLARVMPKLGVRDMGEARGKLGKRWAWWVLCFLEAWEVETLEDFTEQAARCLLGYLGRKHLT